MIFSLFRPAPHKAVIDRLHGEIMAAARQPELFRDYGLADTLDGRFEALALMATLPVRRLAALPEPGPTLAQELTDTVFIHLDDALRAIGTGDVGVPKKMAGLAAAWLGRRQAYAGALDAQDEALLCAALARNAYAGALPAEGQGVRRLARYVRAVEAAQAKTDLDTYIKGPAPFPDAAQTD